MNALHPVQLRLLDLLKETINEPLTMEQIRVQLNLSSTSGVFHHIQQLEKKGFLRRNPYNTKDYQILADDPEKSITYINLYGLAQCGPEGSILEGDPLDRVPIASRLLGFKSSEAFMVKAKGDSMIPKINDGDFVIARKSSVAENGDIIICVNNGMALIKRFQLSDTPILISLNSKYNPFIASEDFRIEGVVRGIFSRKI